MPWFLGRARPRQRQRDGRRATPADPAEQVDSGPLPRPRRRRRIRRTARSWLFEPGDADGDRKGGSAYQMEIPMSMATSTDTRSPALHVADSQELIRAHGARENNLKD